MSEVSEVIPGRWLRAWPVLVGLVAVVSFFARADAQIAEHTKRLDIDEASIRVLSERLARTEQASVDGAATAHRIEHQLDALHK